ncbi:MAG TPA: ParB/RepB/Spo0J family partition protein [Chthoniobacterales bacterium]|jgi:ParB family chromosome partitioning protein|nr:ParB/RepB/Spo0J family partition protein [Chthoniobacterales bacterium]
MAKSGLGKGLGALIGSRPAPVRADIDPGETVHKVRLTSVVPSPLQPRKNFSPEALQELIDSIRQHGIIQPLIVRRLNGGTHELIAGERRWRAAQEVGLSEVPVIVRSASDLEVLELSLIENLQRTDLNPIEEAQGYARLRDEFGMKQEEVAQRVGRSRAAVANALRLLDLHPQVQTWVGQDVVSVGHAKVLLGVKAPEEQLKLAETILRRNASVRQTERLVARFLGGWKRRRRSQVVVSSAAIGDLQDRLRQHFGTNVTIHHTPKRGRIEIEYYGDDDLQRILNIVGLNSSES